MNWELAIGTCGGHCYPHYHYRRDPDPEPVHDPVHVYVPDHGFDSRVHQCFLFFSFGRYCHCCELFECLTQQPLLNDHCGIDWKWISMHRIQWRIDLLIFDFDCC